MMACPIVKVGQDMTESTVKRYVYEVSGGTMSVVVHQAESDEVWRNDKRVTETYPRVYVTTDESDAYNAEPGYVKIRGRLYRVRATYRRVPGGDGWVDREGNEVRWQSEPYCKRENDRGQELAWNAKTPDVLRAMERDVLDRFEAGHPEWRRESVRQQLSSQRSRWQRKAEDARRDLANAQAEIEALDRRLAGY